jgi:Spy/CpxP family protein refolding chaperone
MNFTRLGGFGLGPALLAALLGAGCDKNKSSGDMSTDSSDMASSPEEASVTSLPRIDSAAASAGAKVEGLAGDDDELAAAEVLDHYRYHHGGITSFIAMSLDTLGVSPDRQAPVQAIQYELDGRMAPLHAAERSLLSDLADGVSAGAVDSLKADADLAQIARAVGTVRSASGELINQLHAALSEVERAALVDKVQAHWQVWREANSANGRGPGNAGRESGRLERLARDLQLTPDQVQAIQAGLNAKPENAPGAGETKVASDVDARLATFSTAFVGASFDAKTLGEWEVNDSHVATIGATRMASLCRAAAPVLTPEQRTTFAARLREHRFELAVGK